MYQVVYVEISQMTTAAVEDELGANIVETGSLDPANNNWPLYQQQGWSYSVDN